MSILKILPYVLMTSVFLFGQAEKNVFSWKIEDQNVSKAFLNKYIEKDKDVNRKQKISIGIQESYTLVVDFNRSINKIKGFYVIDYENGVKDLDMDFIHSHFDQRDLDIIKSRHYAWDDVNPNFISANNLGGDIQSIFDQVNYKTNRDIFWWSYRTYDLSSSLRWSVRLPGSKWGFYMERGLSEAGYPGTVYRSLNPGISNEILKIYATLPVFKLINIGGGENYSGTFGLGLKYDSYMFGGFFQYSDITWSDISWIKFPNESYVAFPNVLAGAYFSTTFLGNIFKSVAPGSSARLKVLLIYNQISYGSVITSTDGNTKEFAEYNRSSLIQSFDGGFRVEWVSKLDSISHSNRLRVMTQIQFNPTGIFKGQVYIAYEPHPQLRIGLWTSYITKINYSSEFDAESDPNHIWAPGFGLYPEITIIW